MVPVRSLLCSRLQNPPSRSALTTVQRDTQGGGWQGAYSSTMLVINPSSVGMVPVRSFLSRYMYLQKKNPPARSVPTIVQRDTQGGVWLEAYSSVRLVINPSSVGMVPVRSLLCSRLQNPPSRSALTTVQRDTQGGGWQGAHKYVRLVIIPTFVGMVPVRSLSPSRLQHHLPGQYPPSFNATRRVEGGMKRTGFSGSSTFPRSLGWCP